MYMYFIHTKSLNQLRDLCLSNFVDEEQVDDTTPRKSDLHLSCPVLAHCAPWYCLFKLGQDTLETYMESELSCLSTYFSWGLQERCMIYMGL